MVAEPARMMTQSFVPCNPHYVDFEKYNDAFCPKLSSLLKEVERKKFV